MRDSEILRLVAARIAESRELPVNVQLTFTNLMSEFPEIHDRGFDLRRWLWEMRGRLTIEYYLEIYGQNKSIARVWCVIWLLRLARQAEEEGC